MKIFWNVIGIWFLWQLVMIGAFANFNALSDAQTGSVDRTYEVCKNTNPIIGFLTGLIMPLTTTTFVRGGWCWN